MDFWSRLIGGASSTSSKSLRKNSTANRLKSFKQTCNALYQIWKNSTTLSPESPTIPLIRSHLKRLNSILSDESRGPSPHPCHADAASSQVYLTITKLALATNDPGVISSTAVLFNTLIETQVDGIVDSRIFSRALVELVSSANTKGDGDGVEDGESRLVELVFGVANIIRLRPEVLSFWFFPKEKRDGDDAQSIEAVPGGKEFAGATRRNDFPLFYLLIDYVHYEGRTGDFARTGLLYIIETAAKAKDLERWLIESDMATLMATGLGASYSQLSRLLISTESNNDVPNIIALSDHAHIDNSVQHGPGGQLDAFLSYLLFWQDAIDHCKSPEVNDTLLDHFQILFLEQLLYPSLLESSDVDGGSTSSVITYLCRILESIYQPALVDRILNFLLASPADSQSPVTMADAKKARMSLSRRKSLDILASFSEAAAKPSPTLFNLVDLVLMGIRSRNRQTVVATLRLITVIIVHHHQFANLLIKPVRENRSGLEELRSIAALNTEVEQIFSFATRISDDPYIDLSYENYISSALSLLQRRMHTPPSSGEGNSLPDMPWILNVNDEIFAGVLELFQHFFTNSVLTNLALTNVISALASSDIISLDGWLLRYPERLQTTDSEQSQSRQGQSLLSTSSSEETPVLAQILGQLLQQVETWREEIPDFDLLLAARQELLHRGENNDNDDNNDNHPGSGNMPSKKQKRPLDQSTTNSGTTSPAKNNITIDQRSLPPSPKPPSPSEQQYDLRNSKTPRERSQRTATSNPVKKPVDAIKSNTTITSRMVDFDMEGEDDDAEGKGKKEKASINHILTNVVILYEFILEISALVQVRASVLQDVQLTI